jgi:hypothetical protein
MKYAIIKIDETVDDLSTGSPEESLVEYVDSRDDFIKYVRDQCDNNHSVDCISERDLRKNKCFKNGKYLLINNNKISLVEKHKKTNEGYIFNTESSICLLFLETINK